MWLCKQKTKQQSGHSRKSGNLWIIGSSPIMTIVCKLCLIVFLLISASACGFQPMYGDAGLSNSSLLGSRPEIFIGNIPNREGQFLRNLLIDRLYQNGRPANYSYELEFTPLEINSINMGIRRDGSATRIQIQVSTTMQLVRKSAEEKEVLFSRRFKSVGAHNMLYNQLASLTSREDIVEDILKEMSHEMVTSIDLYFYSYLD